MRREGEGGKLALDVQIREERDVENFLRQTKIKGGGIGIKFISFFFTTVTTLHTYLDVPHGYNSQKYV